MADLFPAPFALEKDAHREICRDWLTALTPVLLISWVYYRWAALAAELLAVGGYLCASLLLGKVKKQPFPLVSEAIVGGCLGAFCLPVSAPFFLPALMGGLLGALAALPLWAHGRFPKFASVLARLHPLALSFLAVRGVFARYFTAYRLPAQWLDVDATASATPLAILRDGGTLPDTLSLLFGIQSGAMGETCAAVLVLAFVYLLIRRRVRVILPAAALCVLAVGSWIAWGNPLTGLLVGSGLMGALLIADRRYAPEAAWQQAVIGACYGGILLAFRLTGGWLEGTSVGILAAGLLPLAMPALETAGKWIAAQFVRWVWPVLMRFGKWIGGLVKKLWEKIAAKSKKNQKNS